MAIKQTRTLQVKEDINAIWDYFQNISYHLKTKHNTSFCVFILKWFIHFTCVKKYVIKQFCQVIHRPAVFSIITLCNFFLFYMLILNFTGSILIM